MLRRKETVPVVDPQPRACNPKPELAVDLDDGDFKHIPLGNVLLVRQCVQSLLTLCNQKARNGL